MSNYISNAADTAFEQPELMVARNPVQSMACSERDFLIAVEFGQTASFDANAIRCALSDNQFMASISSAVSETTIQRVAGALA